MADRTIKPDSGNDIVIQNNGGGTKIEIPNSGDIAINGTIGSGTFNGTIGSSADFPAGHIVQVVVGERKERTTNSGTSPAETNLQATITPTSTSNKILVFVTGSWGITAQNLAKFYLYKTVGSGSAANAITGTSGDAWQILQHQVQGYTGTAGYSAGFSTALALSYLDSPSSVSSLLYELYFASDSSSPTVHFNSRPQDNNAGYAQITLMELTA